ILHTLRTSQIDTLSLHDALPICASPETILHILELALQQFDVSFLHGNFFPVDQHGVETNAHIEERVDDDRLEFQRRRIELQLLRSEEHTSELQSPNDLVCRLLLE